MNITLLHLKKLWDKTRLKKIELYGLTVCSDKILNFKKYSNLIPLIDAVWSEDHDGTVTKRNRSKHSKHIFVSQICGVAQREYKQVLEILNTKTITFVSEKEDRRFFSKSRKFFPNANYKRV